MPHETQKQISKEEYDNLSPYEKGYICYIQAAWNKNIKDENPYNQEIEVEKYLDWEDGNLQAMFDCQDSEE